MAQRLVVRQIPRRRRGVPPDPTSVSLLTGVTRGESAAQNMRPDGASVPDALATTRRGVGALLRFAVIAAGGALVACGQTDDSGSTNVQGGAAKAPGAAPARP